MSDAIRGVGAGPRCPFRVGAMFSLFERLLRPTESPEQAVPPPSFVAFFWHFARQAKGLFAALFAAGLVVALLDSSVPVFMGRIVTLITSVWYILVYGTSALILLASAEPVLALPVALWFLGYLLLLRVLVPRMRDRSKEVSEGRSLLTGRIVDSYTNILTVKLFARGREEDAYVRDAIDHHTGLFYRSLRLNTLFSFCLSSLNAAMVTSTGALALVLWTRGSVEVGTVAMALPLAWQIVSIGGWVALQVTS